jgi:UDP:flavonoid glycosyltransferase YjiC (YdhE family)
VHVERWVPQQDVLAHASAAVVHGGSGSTLGALAAGVPLVVVPLFADQPMNARRVAEVGAGLAVEPNLADVRATIEPLRDALETVLAEPSYGESARAIAHEVRSEPSVDEAIPLLERLGRR